jgi:hypothetical protein
LQEDGSFLIRGDADLEDCDSILSLQLGEEEALKEFATLSGFLCMCAGEIPNVGDFVMSRGWCFEIVTADVKKILSVKVERLVGGFDDIVGDDDDHPLRSFLKRSLGGDSGNDDQNGLGENGVRWNVGKVGPESSVVDVAFQRSRSSNIETAEEVERMVDSQQRKTALLDDAIAKQEDAKSKEIKDDS